jgi:HD superfamily phosphohydrolase
MFSEVYWHHAVRSATAMLQRAFYLLYEQLDLPVLFGMTEQPMITEMRRVATNRPVDELLHGLFGPKRQLYKRLAQYSVFQQQQLYQRLARRPYPWLVSCAEQLAQQLARQLQQEVASHEVLIDAPPVKRELDVDVQVRFPKEDKYRQLRDVSPIVRTLAHKHFDDYVKRVRIFVHSRLADRLRGMGDIDALVEAAIQQTERSAK